MPDLRERFESLNRATLEDYVSNQQEENLHLDFKTISDCAFGQADDRKNLAISLSGFANSDGGMIIWGVDARKGPDDIDCAQVLKPVNDVNALVSKLNQLTSDAVSPVVGGVAHRAIERMQDGSGFVATLVPASDSGPHMAKSRQDRYFKRSGDSFLKMEHFDVADMFGRRVKPDLRLKVDILSDGTHSANGVDHQDFRVVIGIENVGRGSAFAPFLGVSVAAPYSVSAYGVDGNCGFGLPRLVSRDSVCRFGSTSSAVVHPGTFLDVLAIRGSFEGSAGVPEDLFLAYELAAEQSPCVRDERQVEGTMIRFYACP